MAELSGSELAGLIRRAPTGALRARRPGAYGLPDAGEPIARVGAGESDRSPAVRWEPDMQARLFAAAREAGVRGKLLTIQEVSELLECTRGAAHYYVQVGKLDGYRGKRKGRRHWFVRNVPGGIVERVTLASYRTDHKERGPVKAPRRPLSEGFARIVRDAIGVLAGRLAIAEWGVVALVAHTLGFPKRQVRAWARAGVAPPTVRRTFIDFVDDLDWHAALLAHKRRRKQVRQPLF